MRNHRKLILTFVAAVALTACGGGGGGVAEGQNFNVTVTGK